MNGTFVPIGRQRAARRVIAGAALPEEVASLVSRVVRRTRLRAPERAEVARELCSHFHEALAAGRSPADAIAAFGDPAAAAASLRRAAIAKRSAIDRAWGATLRWSARSVAVIVAAYGLFALYLAFHTPRITFDPLERFRAMTPGPSASAPAAWPEIRTALLGLGFAPRQADRSGLAVLDHPTSLPGETGHDALSAALSDRQGALAALRAGAMRPVLGFPLGQPLGGEDAMLLGPELVDQSRHVASELGPAQIRSLSLLLPQVGHLRSAARALSADAVAAAEVGDGARAAEDLVATLHVAQLCQDFRGFITDLSAMAIRALALSRTLLILEWRPEIFTDAQLARLQDAIHTIPPELQQLHTAAEIVGIDDVLQCMYSDDGQGDGWFRPGSAQLRVFQSLVPAPADPGASPAARVAGAIGSPLAAVAVAGRKATRERLMAALTEAEARSHLSMLEAAEAGPGPAAAALAKDRTDGLATTRWLIPAFLTPAFEKIEGAFRRDRALCDATMTAIACERFRRATGRWPASVPELVPRFLPAVPRDTWSRGPLLVTERDGRFRLYSVGADRRDNGGVPHTRTRGPEASLAWEFGGDGDLVFFEPRGTLDRWVDPDELVAATPSAAPAPVTGAGDGRGPAPTAQRTP